MTGECWTDVIGFNGATSFQTWKDDRMGEDIQLHLPASMGPRPFRRGSQKNHHTYLHSPEKK